VDVAVRTPTPGQLPIADWTVDISQWGAPPAGSAADGSASIVFSSFLVFDLWSPRFGSPPPPRFQKHTKHDIKRPDWVRTGVRPWPRVEDLIRDSAALPPMCGLGLHRDGAPLDPRSASGGRFRAEVDALYRRWASDGLLALDTRWRAARAVVADHNGAPGAELDAALSAEAQARAALDQAVLAACQPRKCARPSPSPSPAPAAGGCRPSPSPTPRGRGWPATHGWCDCVACLAAPGPRTGAPPACPGERRVCGVCFCGCRRASVLPGSHAVDPPVGRSPAAVRDGIKKKRQDLVALHPEDGHRRIHCDPARPPPPGEGAALGGEVGLGDRAGTRLSGGGAVRPVV
jgi:hypothetical protein